MNRYRYQAATDSDGQISGAIDAPSVSDALTELEKRGLSVRSIELMPPEQAIADTARADFYAELEALLAHRSEWLPPLQALARELPQGGVRKLLEGKIQAIDRITSAKEFLEDHDAITLLPLIVPRVQSNDEPQLMSGWLTASSQQLESYARQANALIYPLTLLGLALAVFGITFTLVVPIFGSVFEELQIHVPRSTAFLIWASEMVTSRTVNITIYTILGGLLFFVFVRWWRNHALTNRVFGRFVAGRTPNLLAMSSLIESLAELLALKAPLDLALSIAGRNCQHAYYRHAAECLAKNARSGSIDNVHPQAKIRLPPLLIRSLQIGDAGRPNIPMLRELARLYRDRGQRRSAWESGGPGFAILLVGLIIIWIILVLFMPMISMFTSLSL